MIAYCGESLVDALRVLGVPQYSVLEPHRHVLGRNLGVQHESRIPHEGDRELLRGSVVAAADNPQHVPLLDVCVEPGGAEGVCDTRPEEYVEGTGRKAV